MTSIAAQLSPKNSKELQKKANSDRNYEEKRLERKRLFNTRSLTRQITPNNTPVRKSVVYPKPPLDPNSQIEEEISTNTKSLKVSPENIEPENPPKPQKPQSPTSSTNLKIDENNSSLSSVESEGKNSGKLTKSENGIKTRKLKNNEIARFIAQKNKNPLAVQIDGDFVYFCPCPTTTDVVYMVDLGKLEESLKITTLKSVKLFVCFDLFSNLRKLEEKSIDWSGMKIFDVSLAYWALDSTKALMKNGFPIKLRELFSRLCPRAVAKHVTAVENGDPIGRS